MAGAALYSVEIEYRWVGSKASVDFYYIIKP